MFAKDEFEREKASNPKFSDLIVKGESMKECRRLPFPSFLQRPVTRLGRYPLLLDAIMKRLTPSNPEFELADSMLKSIKDLLRDMNKETGIRSNAFKLKKLHENLDWNEKASKHEGRHVKVQDGAKVLIFGVLLFSENFF